jgi:hypothetical protein
MLLLKSMLGRPIREDLERPGSKKHLTADQIQKMQKAMLELWQTSLEFAVTTWRTRGRLRSTPDKVNEWYKMVFYRVLPQDSHV